MKIQILFNNERKNEKYAKGWGFSCLIDKKILFDTGEKADYLFSNMKVMNVDIKLIEAVVISHDHWDHTGGLWELLKRRRGLTVYACPGSSYEFKEKVKALHGVLKQADSFIKAGPDIIITGEIAGEYNGIFMPEQACILKTEQGITVITGCAHPGIIKILESIKKQYPNEMFNFVFGGFHLMSEEPETIRSVVRKFKQMGVKKAGPTHCTGEIAESIFRQEYGNNFVQVKAGHIFEV